MSKRATAHRQRGETVLPHREIALSYSPVRTSRRFAAFLEYATQEMLAVTYWLDPDKYAGISPITVRFSGYRVNVKGRRAAGDKFVQDEIIEEIIPGSGPISLTARVPGITPGTWSVTAHVLESAHPAQESREQENTNPITGHNGPVLRLWHRWAQNASSAEPVSTCLPTLAHVPGILPGIWGAMVALSIVVALALQSLVIAAKHLVLGPWWVITLLSIGVGIAGAKGWYIVLYRREQKLNGWCIQGFITGATLTVAILLIVLKVPIGAFLDATAPGLLIAMAVGRVGCFFAGCCGGPPTSSRFGVWSSDQRVGARRVPTQLLELALAGILGLGALAAVLGHGPASGAYFVAGLSAYVLGRQAILRLRAEPRKTRLGGLVTTALSALMLIVAIIWLVQ